MYKQIILAAATATMTVMPEGPSPPAAFFNALNVNGPFGASASTMTTTRAIASAVGMNPTSCTRTPKLLTASRMIER